MVNWLALAVLLAATVIAPGLMMIVYHPSGWDVYSSWLFGLAFLYFPRLGCLDDPGNLGEDKTS